MKKLMNKKGFTLMEMLIVVAIIVILVAVAVPSFSGALEKANNSTDDANFRTAESLAAMKAIDIIESNTATADTVYFLDCEENSNTEAKLSLLNASTTDPVDENAAQVVEPTRKGDAGKSEAHRDEIIQVVISKTGDVTVTWESHTFAD